ncbi:DUF3397 domain-containing protein [Gracilibacillus caseinilyticus]|uniref:DUF3397 domain-containing protein n=1 Tax=Gracilibacillus caseinilyticus TaxID=2932256 RepID=A0ABY4EWE9_9BACI|nr:DUF3397 domain-containing protein [Gracilibacillus caseinilyticus]UOQ47969.1 DUF3397 domain-containing protein [Gracilibacillus caseinilyticus]
MEGFYYLFALMVTLPTVITLLVYILTYRLVKKRKFSFHFAIDSTTVLYVGSVAAIIYSIFSVNPMGYIALILIVILMICVYIHWKRYTDIVFRQVCKRFWKSTFLLFFVLHIISVCYGLFYQISVVFIDLS